MTIETLASSFAAAGRDIGSVFRWVSIAATFGLLISFIALYVMEERPLRSTVRPEASAAE